MTIFVIAKDGTRLMPTHNIKKIRKQLKDGRVKIVGHDPFTVQQTYEGTKYVQPIELTEDAGYAHIGVSVKSVKHEYISEQRDLLMYEPEHHRDCNKQYRKSRRTRKRHRAPRFDNRKATKPKGWLPPSIEHKLNLHVQIFEKYNKVCPITSVIIEVGQFDTQVLKAVDAGLPIPKGVDYQYGDQYGYDTLREAVFARDNYTCIICNKSAIKDGKIIRMHHLGYWHNDRTNRTANLAVVCTGCHTAKNHKKGGKLYGLKSSTKSLKDAAFMNAVKYQLVDKLKKRHPKLKINVTFGAITKRTRNNLNIAKSHVNDAYCIGGFRPKHRTETVVCQKRQRNNRILEKFYDAKYIDVRDGSVKSGSQIGCNRTNRRGCRNSDKNERIYRGMKKSKGRRSIRKQRYQFQKGDAVLYNNNRYICGGTQHYGTQVILYGLDKTVKFNNVKIIYHCGGWLNTVDLLIKS